MIDMNVTEATADSELSLDYHFNEGELKILASFFRRYQEQIPDVLNNFATQIERKIYSSMSIEEAEAFYS